MTTRRYLDQLTVAEKMPGGNVKILVAVADVDSLVAVGSAIDDHARHNTTSVYTAAKIFPMLPEKLSTDLTSLGFNEDRLAIVIEMVIGPDGALQESDVYRAYVHNCAKLAYHSTAGWLEGNAPPPEAVTAVDGLADNLRVQDQAAQLMRSFRHAHGALSLETVETKPIFADGEITELAEEKEEPGQRPDRRCYDRRQWRDSSLSNFQECSINPPRCAHAKTVGANHSHRCGAWSYPARCARRESTGSFSGEAESRRSASFSRIIPVRDQTAWRG